MKINELKANPKTMSQNKTKTKLIFNQVCRQLRQDPEFKKLEKRQKWFVIYYLETKKQTEAVIKSGYSVKGAKPQGTRLMSNPNLTRLIDKYEEIETELASDEKEDLISELYEVKDYFKGFIGDPLFMNFNKKGAKNIISAISQISKMRGFDAPQKVEGNLSLEQVLKTQEEEEQEEI